MFKILFAVFGLLRLVECGSITISGVNNFNFNDGNIYGSDHDFKHFELNGATLVSNRNGNFAISRPNQFQSSNWLTCALNKNQVTIMDEKCQITTKDWSSLSDEERSGINIAKAQIEAVDGSNGLSGNSFSIGYSGDGRALGNSFSNGNITISTFQSEERSMCKYGNTLSVSKPDLPDELVRIIFNQHGFVSINKTGEIQIKPIDCVSSDERQLMENLQNEWDRERAGQEQRMQELRERLNREKGDREQKQAIFQQKMQKMQQDLRDKLRRAAEERQEKQVELQERLRSKP